MVVKFVGYSFGRFMRNKNMILFVLSEKSSGSSYLARVLKELFKCNNYPVTQHYQNETLYWTKAASVLGLSQLKMLESSVPYSKSVAKADLEDFLSINLDDKSYDVNNKTDLFDAWLALSKRFGPIFIEKSPHHLLQPSVLTLLSEFKVYCEGIVDVQFVCIVRNPITTGYSQYRRWQIPPNRFYEQWKLTYLNWLSFSRLEGEHCSLIRYEELVMNPASALRPLVDKCGIDLSKMKLKEKGIAPKEQYLNDRFFHGVPDESVISLAKKYGYKENELIVNQSFPLWVCTVKLYLYRVMRSVYRRFKPYKG